MQLRRGRQQLGRRLRAELFHQQPRKEGRTLQRLCSSLRQLMERVTIDANGAQSGLAPISVSMLIAPTLSHARSSTAASMRYDSADAHPSQICPRAPSWLRCQVTATSNIDVAHLGTAGVTVLGTRMLRRRPVQKANTQRDLSSRARTGDSELLRHCVNVCTVSAQMPPFRWHVVRRHGRPAGSHRQAFVGAAPAWRGRHTVPAAASSAKP